MFNPPDNGSHEPAHRPVMAVEAVELLVGDLEGTIVDCTVGDGGHSDVILRKLPTKSRLVCIDRDGEAIERSQRKLASFAHRTIFRQMRFSRLGELREMPLEGRFVGFLFDLGLSSRQLDSPGRGFSYLRDGPLDMRFDQSRGVTAEEVVNDYPTQQLASLLREKGEERRANRIVAAIEAERRRRRISSTEHLRKVVESAIPRQGTMKTLSRVFQAIRMEVNDELDELRSGLVEATTLLSAGGRICAISYHSLEDRMVKGHFRHLSQGCRCPPHSAVCVCGGARILKVLTPHPLLPSVEERRENPRARSAKLRAAEKVF